MTSVQAISFEEVDCGKKVAESKKRFRWRFKINNVSYTMELANSTLSGKKIVTLNSEEIYSEKNLLNINFEFNHNIEGHLFRITRIPDNLTKFELRIDNRTFDQLKHKNNWDIAEPRQKIERSNDPFSEFNNFVKTKPPSKAVNNDFGDFDLDTLTTVKGNSAVASSVTGNVKVETPKYEAVDFTTNTVNFQTNNTSQFLQNFEKVEKDLLAQEQFGTNNFDKNNLYLDLMKQKPEQRSDIWSDMPVPAEQRPSGNFLMDKLNLNNLKIDMTAKQALNKVKMTAESIKNKVQDFTQSLI